MEGIVHCSSNYLPLSPISFLERAAIVYRDKVSIVYGSTVTFSWKQTQERCLKLASALVQLEIAPHDIVAALGPNIPALYELHFAVPMAGAILSALNTQLDATTLALLLEQLDAKLIFVDYQFADVVLKALDILSLKNVKLPGFVLISENDKASSSSSAKQHQLFTLEYNSLLAIGEADFEIIRPNNECDPISVNYTSGSTGNPKGVIYSHRAAYLNSLAEIFRCDMRQMPVFLWTVDMFRCNGWCLTWAVAALGGTNICLRIVSAEVIFEAILLHKVTHMCGPPSILNIIANAPKYEQIRLPFKVNIIIAGTLPNSQILMKVKEVGFDLIHGYGMTEALGPAIVTPWRPELDSKFEDEQEHFKCREGVHNILMEGVDVKDPNTMKSVPNDGKTIGEIMFRSNTLMSGYLKNLNAAQEAFKGGWYHTGDLGVRHSNGRIKMKDRAKDIIMCGDEIISTLEVEAVLLSHPKVLEAAVVGKPDDSRWKEVPCAFVKLKDGCGACTEEIIDFCGNQLPNYMIPKKIIILGNLPVNFSGKVQKYVLREEDNHKLSDNIAG